MRTTHHFYTISADFAQKELPTSLFNPKVLLSGLIVSTSYLLWIYFNSPLRKVPGPFLAKFTNLWRLLEVYGGRAELTHQLLHQKYGQAVRIGPNIVSLNDPKLIQTIYSLKGEFLKSDFYNVNDTKVGKAIMKNLFSTQSNEAHAQMLRPIQKFYNMGNVLSLEGSVDEAVNALLKRLDELFIDGPNAGTVCKMEDWMIYYSWDVISQMTFSRPMGFMETASDNTGFIHIAEQALDYFGVVGQIPALDHWLGKNPIMPIGPPTFDKAAIWCAEQSMSRQQGIDGKSTDQKDMLDSFIGLKNTNPEFIDDNAVVGCLILNVVAGADTSAIVLRSIIYFTLKNPRVYKKLVRELDSANLTTPVSYKDAIKLPYLEAVVKEASRVHSTVGLLLERVVPASGLALSDGIFLPPGTIVGINPWVTNQNKKVYGEDANSFVPERWLRYDGLETEEEYQSRLSVMKQADLTFGAGNRVCIGRNIATLTVYKLIATLFLTYDAVYHQLLIQSRFPGSLVCPPRIFPPSEERTFTEIATARNLSVSDTTRFLRLAMTYHVFKEPRDGIVAHTAASKVLVDNQYAAAWLGHILENVWPTLPRMLEAGEKWPGSEEPNETAYILTHPKGLSPFAHLEDSPAAAKQFSDAMKFFQEAPGLEAHHLLEAFDFFSLQNDALFVDVGGSHGAVSISVARSFPSMRCIVQDLPATIAKVAPNLPSDVQDRVSFMEHDFFKPQPIKGADVYYFRWIFHDWSDLYSAKILKALIPGLKAGAKIVISDVCMPEYGQIPLYMQKLPR
ncbi:hypothetical protein NHQ30_000611 [Ciborinia camelliae]|nr:hypothetical protein NHQ30_000611 [Ciborinia camelliae]